MSVTQARLFRLIEATWPAASARRLGPFTIREGQGGGSRVSAATVEGRFDPEEIGAAEAAMRALGQVPLFMVRGGEDALDAALAARGYKIKDPVIGYAAPVAPLLAHLPPPVTSFEVWPPLALQAETWAAGGIGPARLAVMERVGLEKTTLFGRLEDAPAGAAFVALSEGVGMIHAIEVAPAFRRKGLGRYLIAAAARWVKNRGGSHLSLIVTRANGPANALYSSLGMTPVGNYHYRIHPEGT